MIQHRTTFGLIVLLATAAVAVSAHAHDPKLRWRTIQTEHFNIHYHQGETFLAYKGARVFEEVHAILTIDLDHTLAKKRLDVVITDETDDANGFASSLPYPSITLYATAPMSRASLQGYDDWLWAIFVHEYTHILHIDTTEGVNKVFRVLFGGYVKPNKHNPGWMIEGFAVNNETYHTGGGRGRSAWADMLVRMSVLDHRFPSLGQADGYIDDWPGGHLRYIWGGHFHLWIEGRYGHGIWTEMSHHTSAQLIPFILPGKQVLGKRFDKLWKEWEDDLELRYGTLERELLEEGVTDAQQLTQAPDFASQPMVSPDGEWIYHSYRYERGARALRRMRPDGSDAEDLSRNWHPEGMTLSDDGKTLYFTAIRPYRIDYTFYDLYSFDVDGKRPFRRKRLTRGERVFHPDLHPDGDRLVCVTNGLGHNDLAIWTEADGLRAITATQDYTQYSEPAWSPQGDVFAVSAWLPGGYRDILLMDEQGQVRQRVTEDRAVDIEPTWSPDGEYLLFSSDRSGIYNIYARHLASGELLQVTNVISGAFHPQVTPDCEWLIYEGYTSHGSDLRRAIYQPQDWRLVTESPPPSPPTTLAMPPDVEQELPSRRYNPLPSLLPPRYILPDIEKHNSWSDLSLGAHTSSRDAMRFHRWGASASYRTGHKYFSWGAYYSLEALRPDFTIGYYNYSISRGRIWEEFDPIQTPAGTELEGIYLGDSEYLERRDRAYLRMNMPLHARHSVFASYQFDWHQPLGEVPETAWLSLLPGKGSYSGLQVGYVFRHIKSYRYSSGPESGFQASISADLSYPWLGAVAEDWTGESIVQSQTIVAAEARGYIAMPWWKNHVLALRGAGGTTLGVPLSTGSFRLGGTFSEGSSIGAPSHGYPLHGYQSGAMAGDRMALMSVEYRFPLFFIERGLGALPIYVRGMHAAAIFDAGQVWRAGDYPSPEQMGDGATAFDALGLWFKGVKTGMAFEVSADLIPGWNGMLRVKLGYAAGLAKNGIKFGEDSFYFQVGSSF